MKNAKLGAGAVAVERATDVLDNPLVSTVEGAVIGAAVGGIPGAIAGGLIGFILADGERVTPIDMIAIPAYQYSSMLQGREPTFQIFIKEGELIAPVLATDYMESVSVVNALSSDPKSTKKRRAKGAGLPKKYAKMGFKKGWREFKKTPAYKKRKGGRK